MGTLKRVAPIFPVRDLSASHAHHQRLGFATREFDGGGYGYATREDGSRYADELGREKTGVVGAVAGMSHNAGIYGAVFGIEALNLLPLASAIEIR